MNFSIRAASGPSLAIAVVLAAWSGAAVAAPAVTAGCDSAPSKATVLYTNLGNQAAGAKEMFVATAGGAGSSADVTWGTTTTTVTSSPLEFSYSGSAVTGKARGVAAAVASGSIGPINFARITLEKSDSPNKPVTLELRNAFVGAVPVGTLVAGAVKCWTVSGVDLSGSFSITGTLALQGDIPGGSASVRIDVGHVAPSDADAPVVTDVEVNPDPVLLNGTARVTALVDDVDTGGSRIRDAQYALNDGDWLPMAAMDGGFDSSAEGVQADFAATRIGENRVCVRGTDAAGNTSAPLCQVFRTTYRFEAFFSPIDMDALNSARAGQGIPAKWRLTDANGVAITDPASFVSLVSSVNACAAGLPTDAVEEEAAGSSGLQYLGDGYWQFNWKTPKDYAGSCRGMFVKFDSGQVSPLVKFQFRR